jgi:cytochrome c-type biogenesis protein CcmH/NrfF
MLIARGETQKQILRDMVAQYGQAVLALPKASGFNLLIYILPPAGVALAAAALALTLPKWRRRARAGVAGHPELVPELAPEEANRLEADLSLY